MADGLHQVVPQLWSRDLHIRHWQILRWLDQPVRPQEDGGNVGISKACCLPRQLAKLVDVCLAFGDGGATKADIIDRLLGRRDSNHGMWHSYRGFNDLDTLSSRKLRPEFRAFSFLIPLVECCRKRILEVELTRGDTPTAASGPALSLSSIEGIENLVAVLRVLGKRNFIRGWSRDNQSLETVMSHLARHCFPLARENARGFHPAG